MGPRATNERDLPSAHGLTGWFIGRLPDDWFDGPPEVVVDREEVLVVGTLPAVADDGRRRGAGRGRGRADPRFREQTREERMRIAREAERRYGRKVAWGARVGETRQVFTSLSVPVMTRLRQPERQVLDTLVDSGRRAQPVRGAGLVRAAGRAQRRRVAVRAAGGDGVGRAGAPGRSGRLSDPQQGPARRRRAQPAVLYVANDTAT